MPNITRRNFSAGWTPGSDPINGDPNGLLQMDNVDLDTNGALSLAGGTTVVGSAFAANFHTIYSRTMNGTRAIYGADTSGNMFRDSTNIGGSGNASRAAFGTAFDYVLACSGNTRKKDLGSGTPANLGVGAPTVKPTVARNIRDPYKTIGDLNSTTVTPVGASAVIAATYLQVTANASGRAAVQTYNDASNPRNNTVMTESVTSIGNGLPTDEVTITGYTTSPWGKRLQISVLLVASNVAGDVVSDYYSYTVEDLSTLEFNATTGIFTLKIKREDFTRVGTGGQGWDTTYGFRIDYTGANGDVINFFGSTIITAGLLLMQGGSRAQNGSYQYMQVNVNNTGTYQALSPMGPISDSILIINTQGLITPQSPAAIDTQVNEVWLYRRGGLLDDWYRVKVYLAAGAWVVEQDTMSDLDALKLNIRYNSNLTTIASSGISDKIVGILGPIQRRWYYFTEKLCYPSDLDNPDLVDATKAIRLTGSNNEIFMWAKQVDKATVLVGTSVDVYVLNGTFATLPDFSIDIYYFSLGCKYPPIAYDADAWAGQVFYLASDGWRFINAGGGNELIVAPQLDKLYKGLTCNGYAGPNLKVAPGATRFPVVVAKNKLWCFITGTSRCEVFDFIRKYWRAIDYTTSIGDALCATSTQDGQVVAFYDSDNKVREIDVKTTKLIDGVTKQRVGLTWTVSDGGTPRNRKDSSVFKTRIYTGGTDLISVSIANDAGVGQIVGTVASATPGLDKFIDISDDAYVAISKTYKVSMIGFVADFLLEDWSIDYTLRPDQISFLRLLPENFGTASKKRLRNWPAVIDTLGYDVVFTPSVDDSSVATTTLNSIRKDTQNIFYTTDVFGVDYGGTFTCASGLFEFYQMMPPAIVQVLPIAKRFDQIGPDEFFKYGKIRQFELRVLPDGGSSIPYTVYLSDTSSVAGSLSVVDGKEDSYFIDVPKGSNGRIVRVVLGPTSFDFHRFYARFQVAESGKDTEMRWITVANE